MEKTNEERGQQRKAYAADGTRGQKHTAFRCDLENLEWLQQQPNKGRYINNLIEADRKSKGH